jgi:putative PIN family toxin of toxin-antitoxin system
MRAVLDTNILISATWSPKGVPAQVTQKAIRKEFEIFYSKEPFAEYDSVLRRPKFSFPESVIRDLLDSIQSAGSEVLWVPSKEPPFIDESDRKFYDIAKTNGCLLVTGNAKHYPKEPMVVSAGEFLGRLGTP